MTQPLSKTALDNHIAVLGKTGSGKTSTAKLVVEHLVDKGARVCVLDPIKSDWWGLTSTADGRRAGLPFQILGGPHGHVPLHDGAGHAIGELVASGALPLSIIDMADFKAGGPNRFFNAFAETLFRKMRGVLYLVIEEAHEFAPKERSGVGDENMAVYYAKKLATGSRSKGIRLIVCSQAVQLLHNRVLGSCETLIVHRFTAPADQAPVLTWLKANVDSKAEQETVSKSLRGLKNGEGWICSADAPLERRQFPRIRTFDNSATPESNEHRVDVVTAKVDVEKLRSIVGQAVDQAEAEDPKKLRARISELEREAKVQRPAAIPAPVGFTEAQVQRARQEGYTDGIVDGRKEMAEAVARLTESVVAKPANLRRAPTPPAAHEVPPKVPPHHAAVRAAPRPTGTSDVAKLGKAERRVLTALAQYPQGRSKSQVAILSGYASTGGGFNNALSALRTKGFIEGSGDRLQITEAGVDGLGAFDPLPHGEALLEHWMRQLGKAERAALQALVDVFPDSATKESVAAAASYEPNGGGFNNALSRLRSLELIAGRSDGLRASEDLFG